MSATQLQNVALERLKPHPRNSRTHPQKQIRQIADSIAAFGFTSPIVTDENYVILAGHGRHKAAAQLGLQQVPVLVLRGLPEAKKRALLLADNRLAEKAGWERSTLAIELSSLAPALSEIGLDIEITGFETGTIDILLGELCDTEADPAPEPPALPQQPVSKGGDLWQLGAHRLLCGDARDRSQYKRLLGRERAVMMFADPPYNVPTRAVQGRGKVKHANFIMAAGEMSKQEFTDFLQNVFSLAAEYTIDGSIHYVCMDWRHLEEISAAGSASYAELKNLVVWNKTNAGQGSFYRSQHELIFVFKSGSAEHLNNFELGQHGRTRSNVWTYAGANSFRLGRMDHLSVHPTVKPVTLIADAMKDCSRRGDIVFDPFIGSGTTIVAAEKVGRRAYGLELDRAYVDVAISRWQAFTKRDAVLSSSGETFETVAAARREGAP